MLEIDPTMPRAITMPSAIPATEPSRPLDGALDEKQVSIWPRDAPERAQDADLRSPLRHGNRERVVDDEHADEEREHARNVHRDRVDGERGFELLPARRGGLDLEPDAERRLNRSSPAVDRDALLRA